MALTESSVNLDLARLVRSRLEQAGVQVLLTREDDSGWGPCIDERGQVAARAERTRSCPSMPTAPTPVHTGST